MRFLDACEGREAIRQENESVERPPAFLELGLLRPSFLQIRRAVAVADLGELFHQLVDHSCMLILQPAQVFDVAFDRSATSRARELADAVVGTKRSGYVGDGPPSVRMGDQDGRLLDFLWRSADKFATGFEVVRALSRKDLVT